MHGYVIAASMTSKLKVPLVPVPNSIIPIDYEVVHIKYHGMYQLLWSVIEVYKPK